MTSTHSQIQQNNALFSLEEAGRAMELKEQYGGLIAGYTSCVTNPTSRPPIYFLDEDVVIRFNDKYGEYRDNLLKPLKDYVEKCRKFKGLLNNEAEGIEELIRRINGALEADLEEAKGIKLYDVIGNGKR